MTDQGASDEAPDGPLTEWSAVALLAALSEGRVSAAGTMTAFLDRIESLNPLVNAIVSMRPRADLMAEAAAADAKPRHGLLHGLPMAVKDLVATAGIRTTWGSPIFADHIPETDALLAARLRAAGAILIGKTNAPEFGLGSQTYNPVHGITRNPYDLSRTAGGSSGGAAAALAARLVPLADGSDMMGSLRNPAAFNNIYGFRPSWGLIPGEPEGDLFLHTLATEGPMARSIDDLALLLDVIAGPDPRLPFALPAPRFSGALNAPVAGKRIGWLGDWGGALPMESGIIDLCETALARFEELDVIVEPVPPPFSVERLWESWTTLRAWAVATQLGEHHADLAHRELLKQEAREEIDHGLALGAMDVHRASVGRSEWFVRLAGLFEAYDALALPSAQVFPFDAELPWPSAIAGRAMSNYHRWMEVVVPVSLAGVPCMALPAGFGKAGMPAGLQLFGRRGADVDIVRLGQAYHRATQWPQMRPPERQGMTPDIGTSQ